MEVVPVKIVPRGFGETQRRDSWWWEPVLVLTVLGSFVVYATWAAFQGWRKKFARWTRRSIRPGKWLQGCSNIRA